MKREEFEAQQQAIPDDKLVEMAQNALSKLCETGGRSLTMTVPPRVDDTDMIISELIRRFKDKQPLPPAKGAEEMIRERFGADVFENPPYYPTFAVELQQLMETFATLHAQRIADKMVKDMRQKLFSMRSSKEPMYRLSEADRLMMYGYHDCINEMLMWTKPREI